jgi:simple sugar transport system ATP-binding protein
MASAVTELVASMTGEKAAELVDPRPPAPVADRPILEVRGVTVADACNNVTFDVLPGEIVGLAGAGGSGKFDVANVIAGLLKPDRGTVSIGGQPQQLGSVPKALKSGRRRAELAWNSVERLDVVPRNPKQAVADLSGGNQQKVVMGRALADDPRVLVLMSPTAGVDVRSKQSLMNTAVETARDGAGARVVCHWVAIRSRR